MRKTTHIIWQTACALLFLGYSLSVVAAGQSIQKAERISPAPIFELVDLNDQVRSLKDYRGKVVAVNFWATWCPPCRKELPSMQRAYKALKDKGFVILAVNVGEDWDTVAPFLANFSLEFPVLFDEKSSVISQYGVLGLPTTFILDREGNVTHRISGGRDWDDKDFLKELQDIVEAN